MGDFFYNLGRSVRAGAQKAKWVFESFTGSDADGIRAEREAGIEIAREFEKEMVLEKDEAIIALLEEVGGALKARVKSKLRKFTIKGIELPEPNAFALPGGFVYVTRSLIELCAGLTPLPLREGQGEGRATANPAAGDVEEGQEDVDKRAARPPDSPRTDPADATLPQPLPKREGSQIAESLPKREGSRSAESPRAAASIHPAASLRNELAFILGHEMGHVVRGHAMQRMVNSTLVSTASKAVPIGGMVGKVLVQAGSKALSSAYSQDHELEADAFGLRLARAAGFDEAAAVQMMRRLQKLGGDHPEDSLGSYFASHPPFEVRIRHLRKAMRK